jgi:hypothetical protein
MLQLLKLRMEPSLEYDCSIRGLQKQTINEKLVAEAEMKEDIEYTVQRRQPWKYSEEIWHFFS